MNFEESTYGATYQLTGNPHHKTQLAHMVCLMQTCMHRMWLSGFARRDAGQVLQGLRPDTIFGCLYEFLFDPLPEVKEMFHRQLAVMQDSSTLKIAIQV